MGAGASSFTPRDKTDINISSASETKADAAMPNNHENGKGQLAVPSAAEEAPPAAGNAKGTTKQPSGTSYGLEEFVDYDKVAVSYGKLGDGVEEHPLYKSDLVLVRDKNGEIEQPRAIIYKSTDMYITDQLNVEQYTQFASAHHGKSICKISLRMEPVLFIEDTANPGLLIPLHLYSIRQRAEFLPADMKGETCSDYEVQVRKELSTLTTQCKGFQYYTNISSVDKSLVKFNMEGDDDLLTLTEVNAELSLLPYTSCVRCPLPYYGLPPLSVIDELVDTSSSDKQSLLLIEDGDISHPRCQFATCIALITRGYCQEVQPTSKVESSPFTNHAADALVRQLSNGNLRRYEVDQLLTAITTFTAVNSIQNRLSSLASSSEQKNSKRFGTFTSEDVHVTQMYLMLIIFNHYWHQEIEERFSTWLNREGILMSMFSTCSCPLLPDVTTGLGNTLVLVNNSKHYDDHLCTLDFNNVANLRGIPKLPIYGVCQPTKQGLLSLLTFIKNLKHSQMWLISVREDPTVLCNGEVYCLRDSKQPTKPLVLNNVSGDITSSLEKEIVTAAKQGDIAKIIPTEILSEPPTFESPSDVYSAVDGVTFLHIPLPLDSSPSIPAVQAIQDIVREALSVEGHPKPPAIVFYCDTGRDRTTAGMSVAGLAFSSVKGYAYGAAKGEVERTAIWNGMYTRGEFKIIQRILSAMPYGHQSKREVDFILDQCFETSSMMHYHAREEIFLIYNKKDKFRALVALDHDGLATICIRGPKKGTGMELNLTAYYNQLHKQSLDNLERYAFLIIYNHYLKNTAVMASEMYVPSFTEWLSDIGARSGLLQMLDRIQFWEFEPECPLRSRLARNCHTPMSQGIHHNI